MNKMKDKLPEGVRNAGRFVKSCQRYQTMSSKRKKGVKIVNARNNEKKNMVFLINFPQAWNSVRSIYDEALKRDDINVFVVAVPQIAAHEDDSINISSRKNEAYEFFKNTDVKAIKANTDDGRWIDLRELNPDYVIYIRSYNMYTPTMYKSFNVCQFAKCFYVPYAYGMLGDKMLSVVLPEDFTFTMQKIFFANDSRRIEYAKMQPFYRKGFTNRFKYLVFSRFDFCKLDKVERNYDERNFTIAWMPRWAADDKPDQKTSHFLTYYKQFLEYCESNLDINLIIRPHPNMFASYIENGIMSEVEVEAFKKKCFDAPNIKIDEMKDYSATLRDADVLVADYTSLIAEFFMMGKPIIFCDSVEGLNYEGSKICGSSYAVDSFTNIADRIQLIRNNNDELKDLRKSIISELLPSKTGEIGRGILEEILNS